MDGVTNVPDIDGRTDKETDGGSARGDRLPAAGNLSRVGAPVEHRAEPAMEQGSESVPEVLDIGVGETERDTQGDTERSARLGAWPAAPLKPDVKIADKSSETTAITLASPAATAAAGAAAAAADENLRKGWFGSRRKAAAEPATPAPEPTGAQPPEDPFAAMKEAIAARPRRERQGGSKPVPSAGTAQSTGPLPDKIDLEPVREAMQAVALQRVEVSTGGVAVPTAAGKASADVSRVGVLLVNLGTPDAPTPRAVRRYLRQFLSDRRVIEKDTFAWQLVLKGIILPFRPRSKARAYKSIWNREKNESPLKTVTRAQAEKLGAALAESGADTVVDWAMRYGNPSIGSRIKALMAQGCERILIVPLYPQYSSATTATVCDEAFRVVSRLRNQPSLRIAPPYYADPVYIEAIASSIRTELAKLSFEPEVIIASYHGMPLEYVQKGDPYLRQCTRTTELLRERLGKSQSNFLMTFQSRFGRAEWLQPYTDQTLRKLAKDGVKSVAVVTPGFATDCLETLEEIAIENAHIFKKKGGRNFAFIPCLNDSERGMLVICEIAGRELNGWV